MRKSTSCLGQVSATLAVNKYREPHTGEALGRASLEELAPVARDELITM